MNKITRIYIVDSHEQALNEIRQLLNSDGYVDVVGATSDTKQALKDIVELRPDIVVRDLTEPGLNGLDLVRRVHRALPDCKVLTLTLHHDEAYIVPIVQAGASGSIVKDYMTTRLIPAVNSLAQGDVYFGQVALKTLAENLARD